jgi:hypothetical protein
MARRSSGVSQAISSSRVASIFSTIASSSPSSLATRTIDGTSPAASRPNLSAAPGTPTVAVALTYFWLPAMNAIKQAEAQVAPLAITVAIFAFCMMAASRTPSMRLPLGELNRIPDTGRPELIDALTMSLSRLASPSAISPVRRTIVLFSLERVVVRSAADADQHAAATHANANTPLNTAVCHPSICPVGSFTPVRRRLQSPVNNFNTPCGSVAAFGKD